MSDRSTLTLQAIRYLIGGASTTVLCWGLVWVFVELANLHYLLGINLATFGAYGYSYAINKMFVFEDRAGGHVIKGSKFILLQGLLLAFTNVFMYVGVTGLGVNYMIAVVVVSVLNAGISFAVMRWGIFKVIS